MSTQGDDGVDVSVLDASGWCSPSAELVAIEREDDSALNMKKSRGHNYENRRPVV